MPDFRTSWLVLHPLRTTLFLIAYSHLCGATTQRNKEAFLRAVWSKVCAVFEGIGAECSESSPSDSTIGRICKHIDPAKLSAIIEAIELEESAVEFETIANDSVPAIFAIDGKARTAAPTGTGKCEIDVAIFDARRKVLIGKVPVGAKEGEQPAAREAVAKFARFLPSGFFTADAGIACRAFTKTVTDNFHDYVLSVKENAGELHQLLEALPWDEFECETGLTEKGHGRTEGRFLHLSRVPRGQMDILDAYAELSIIGRIERFRLNNATGARSRTYSYFIASEKHTALTEATAFEALRAHWSIENNLHRTRDVELGEDDLMKMSCSSSRTIGAFLDLVPLIARGTGAGIRYVLQALRADPMAMLEDWLAV